MMWRAAGWAGNNKLTQCLMTADKSKPLKFNRGHTAERGIGGIGDCVWEYPLTSLGLEAGIHRLLSSGA